MNGKTLAEIYDLSGFEPDVIKAQMQWASVHCGDQEASAEAGRIWGRKVKHLAYVWNHLLDHDRDYTRHELMSLILIAGVPRFERGMLFEQWRDTTMSYEQVRCAVDALKKRTSKTVKTDRKKIGESVEDLIIEGQAMSNLCYNGKQDSSINTSMRQSMETCQSRWDTALRCYRELLNGD